jgi:alpha-D-ribose 1-methylphosphonate 5-triphosphate diphosphatase PhnM
MFHQQTEAFQSNQAISAGSQKLAISALDTLLCALVDRPKNMRAFEESGGLESIVQVLKDRNVAQQVRYDDTVFIRYEYKAENRFSTA